ncbi:hypothetical protein B0H14DRAFT_2569461 [Mycena olivaceomarginata]|nr:hypothetical protein B0H14DRAFT_2569461 [Mycena olivaceomarginata]
MALAPGSSSEHSDLLNMDDETVQAVIKSASNGDMESLVYEYWRVRATTLQEFVTQSLTASAPTIKITTSLGTLFKLQASLSGNNSAPFPPRMAALSSHSSLSLTPTNLSSTDSIPSPSITMPSVSLAPAGSDSAILSAGGMLVEALKRADGLCDVISQIENGDVAKIWGLYGPQTGRATKPMWTNIKGDCSLCGNFDSMKTITRRERIGQELEREFGGDKAKFIAFFTVPDIPTSGGKKRKAADPAENFDHSALSLRLYPIVTRIL